MWDVSNITEPDSGSDWKRARSVDLPAAQSLYNQIVPPLLHPIEALPEDSRGWLCSEGARSYISVMRGMAGVVLTPLIHPEETDVSKKFSALIHQLPEHGRLPIYTRVRSYQAWLEPVLEDLGARAANRQAVMVKHLARMLKNEQALPAKQAGAVTVQPSHFHQIKKKAGKVQ
jgi:hypothetical protein